MANSIIDPKDPDYCETCGGECVAGCKADEDDEEMHEWACNVELLDTNTGNQIGECWIVEVEARSFEEARDAIRAKAWQDVDTRLNDVRIALMDDFTCDGEPYTADTERSFVHMPSAAFKAERPWCGWMMAFAAESDWDTTGFGLEKLMSVNFLLTTADGRSRPVRMKQWQWIEDRREGEARAHVPAAGIEVVELDADNYEPLTPERRERVRYEDIREIVVF